MKCPKEFRYALFVDGELPEHEAREIAAHLESCDACDRLVTALRGENRVLVQCLQDIDLEEAEVPEFSATPARSIGAAKFALVVIGAALAFKISTGLVFGFDLPAEVEWLNPREWALSLGVAVNAGVYAIQNAGFLTDTAQSVVLAALAGFLLFGMSRAFKRGAAASSIIGIGMAIALTSTPSYAVDLRKGAAASIPATETVDDTVFASADNMVRNVDVAGTVKGDLFTVGEVVTVSGTVEGNVIVVARRVEISGTVGGTVFGAAHTVMISGKVARNLINAGDNINILKTGEIGGNWVTASRDATVDGNIHRDLISAATTLDLRGNVGRHVAFFGEQVSLAGASHVGGNLHARVGKEENVRVATGAVIEGQKNLLLHERTSRSNRYLTLRFYVWQTVRVITLFVTGLLLFKLAPSLIPSRFVSGTDWLKAGGVGFATLVAVPVAAIIAAVTIIGLPIALVSFVLYLGACYFAKVIVAEFVGRSVMHNTGALSLLAGVFLVIVAVNLPWIGGLINFVLILLGLGAIAVTIYNNLVQRRTGEI
jgi:anti-sigma factor RsiW/cytoskeletal protein CcmA (bactofilin family)